MRDLFSNKNEVNSICGGVGTCTCLNKKGVAAKFVGIVTHDECVKSCETCGYFNQKFVSVVHGMRDINKRFFYREEEFENKFMGYFYRKYQ